MTYSMLERFVRRFSRGREWNRRFYRRYLTWNTRQVLKGNLGRQIPRSEVRDMGLAIRSLNKRNQDKHYD